MFENEWIPPDGGDADLGTALARLAERVAPGPATAALLADIDPLALTGVQQVHLLKAWDRHVAWAMAQQCAVLAAMDCPTDGGAVDSTERPELVPGPGDPEWTQLEVAAALRLAPGTAAQRLDVARALHRRLPETRKVLTDGRISYWHALRIADATRALDAPTAAAVESRVLPDAVSQSVGQLRGALGKAVIAAGPAAAQAAHEQATADRTVNFQPQDDGMAGLWMVGPAPEVATVYTALRALADRPRKPGDSRSAGARRFDSLHEIAAGILAGGEWPADDAPLPTKHAQRPHIGVTVAASTLLGLDEQPGELAGYGPINAETARRIAAEGTWRRILFDPADGQLLNYGRKTYEPPADLRRHVIARDRTCTFPHCPQPAIRCDIDHAVPWDQGGCTCPENCHALCRRHHLAKTHGGWTGTRTPDNTTVWTSPTGHTYTVRPPPYSVLDRLDMKCDDPPETGADDDP